MTIIVSQRLIKTIILTGQILHCKFTSKSITLPKQITALIQLNTLDHHIQKVILINDINDVEKQS